MSAAKVETNGHHYDGGDHHGHLNGSGARFIETIDPEDPEYRRELQRPADVKEDMRQMESRQRVSSILNSQAFREELESIIADQLKHGPHPASLLALQQISELLLPNMSVSRHIANSSMARGGNLLIAINDIRGIDTLNYAKGERMLRCKLASLFRVVDLFGWTSGINNIISVRLNQDLEQFLVNPHGLLYHEVTASSLIKVSSNGSTVEPGSSTLGCHRPSFQLHAAIYKARPDLRCLITCSTPLLTSISALKCGLLPVSAEAIACQPVAYHEYKGSYGGEEDVRRLLAEELGPLSKCMFVRSQGVVVGGETIEEALHVLRSVVSAADVQQRAMQAAGGLENLWIPSPDVQKRMLDARRQEAEESASAEHGPEAGKKWKVGELEFEALMRCLDNAGYRTGYMYRQPIMRSIDRNAVKEVEIPPAATSHNYDAEYIKRIKEERQKLFKGEWLASPNVYAKTELEETGTPNPKKITKWVSEHSPNKTSTPIRIESKNQFAPQGADPKEFKNQQKQIKQDRFEDKKTPGYQSKILENIDKDGRDNLNENQLESNVLEHYIHHTVGSPTVIYGAASKGIIRRDQQNNATVYKTYYSAANPFQQMDPVELEKYKREVAEKQIKQQAQRKDKLHKELLESVKANDKVNRSEIISTETSNGKKKSHTIPRSKSLLDKKHEKAADHGKANSGGSQSSSPQSSRESSQERGAGGANTTKDKSHNTTVTSNPTLSSSNVSSPKTAGQVEHASSSSTANKSATMPPGSASSDKKQDKPKKKSKLSFLSRKKNKD